MKILFNSSLQSDRNMVSQLTLTYSLIAVVSFETKCVFVYRHSAQIVFEVSKCEPQVVRNAFSIVSVAGSSF